jgi:hypothetical protein
LTHWVRSLLVTVLFAVGALVLSWRTRKKDVVPFAFALAALGFGVLTIRSGRFLEYFVPFSVCAFALGSRPIRSRLLAPVLLGACVAYSGLAGLPTLASLSESEDLIPPRVTSALRKEIPPGAQVFTPGWDATGLLLLALPDRRFMVALDPSLFYVKDPALYLEWIRLTREAPPGLARITQRRFGARYVLALYEPGLDGFVNRMMAEPRVRTKFFSGWLFYDLGDPD